MKAITPTVNLETMDNLVFVYDQSTKTRGDSSWPLTLNWWVNRAN